MAYSMEEGKRLVVQAGLELVKSGLIARTWGNVSARISDTEFVITTSGIPYEKLTPDDIVPVKIEDCSYDEEGLKPSSEKGVHASAYQLHPEVNFVIHTHQIDASAISITGTDIPVPASSQALLGPTVPNAAYGMPSTNKLKKGVYTAMKKNPKSTSVLMRHHGAVCLGKDYEEAFAVASALEKLSGEVIRTACGGNDLISAYLAKNDLPKVDDVFDLGSSSRNGDTFTLTMKDGSSYTCSVESGTAVIGTGIAPRVSRLHAAIYQANDIQYIKHDTNPYVVALSENGSTEKPFLDDFTQIAGIDVKNVSYDETERRTQNEAVASAMKGRNACFIKGMGALCTGNNAFEAEAVELVLEKESHAALYAGVVSGAKTLSPVDCALQRTVYVMKYSKLASKK